MVSKLADYLLENPLFAQGQQALQAGSSTAPVYSPLEGLARALQGGVGGFFQGQALRDARGEQKLDQTALADAMTKYATDPEGARSILATRPGLTDVATALLTSDVGFQRQKDLLTYKDQLEQQGQTRDAQMFGLGGGAPQVGSTPQPSGGAAAPNQQAFVQTMMPHAMAVSQATGLDPRLVLAQSALETGYGAAAPGNNYFGIKGPGQVLNTTEAGPGGGTFATRDSFRSYGSPAQSAQDYAQLVKSNSRYAPVLAAQGLDAQIDAMGKSGYATDPNYAAKLRQIASGLPDMQGAVAQGASPQVAPGQPAPQQGLNAQPSADTINYQGLQLPKAAIVTALRIPDKDKRATELSSIVREAVKQQQGPEPGTTAGDVHVLNRALQDPAFAAQPEYKAAFFRVFGGTQSQGGQIMQQDSGAYPKPIGEGGQSTPHPQSIDTPQSRFTMANKLADDFNQLDPVKRYGVVEPVYRSMVETAGKNDKLSDANLVYGISTIFDPGSVVRDGERLMIMRSQSLPDQVKGWINSINGGSALSPETRQGILREAGSRVGALKAQHDAIAAQYTERAQRYGLDPQDVITRREGTTAPAQPAGAPIKIDINGKPI